MVQVAISYQFAAIHHPSNDQPVTHLSEVQSVVLTRMPKAPWTRAVEAEDATVGSYLVQFTDAEWEQLQADGTWEHVQGGYKIEAEMP